MRKMNYLKKIALTSLSILAITGAVNAQSKVESTFGKGISIMAKDSSFTMKFSTRFQSLMVNELVLQDDISDQVIGTDLLIRRARLKFGGYAFNPKFGYKIELGLSNRDHGSPIPETKNSARIILDAALKYKITKNTTLWVGQTKLPGNRERVISSQQLQFVDRSLLNSKYNIDRDMGLQLHNKHKVGNGVLIEKIAVSQGEGRNITVSNRGGFEYTGRVEWLPMGNFTGKGDYSGSDLKREQKPKLSLAVTYDYHDNAARQRANQGSFLSTTRTLSTVMADLMFKYKGFSMMAEYADKNAPKGSVVSFESNGDVDEYFYTGKGLNVQAGYLFKSNWEVAGRYTQIDPSAVNQIDNIKMYTIGVSKYIVGHALKMQTDVSLTQVGTNDAELMHRIQFELAF
ncbi:MAG: phosphate-selective porin OprO/OprP [Saprospiraceae bacterium]|jgi:phosphate-selective porin OprO/OprP